MELISAATARHHLARKALAFPDLRDRLIEAANAAITKSLGQHQDTVHLVWNYPAAQSFTTRHATLAPEKRAKLAETEAQHGWRQFRALLRKEGHRILQASLSVPALYPLGVEVDIEFSFALKPPTR